MRELQGLGIAPHEALRQAMLDLPVAARVYRGE
jgi:hypothetical protein